MEEITAREDWAEWTTSTKGGQCYSYTLSEILSLEQQRYLCLTKIQLQWAPHPLEDCPDVKDVDLWWQIGIIRVLLALKVMLPNQFILGFHRDVKKGRGGVDLCGTR